LGIQAEFKAANDILVDERKISGNAQTRRNGILLQHGTVLYQVDVEKMFALLSVSEVKLSDKLIHSVKKRVTSVCEHQPVSLERLAEALQTSFAASWQTEPGDYTSEELARAETLAQQKYSAPEWVGMR
jgi:lipoate-protein ligase A